LKQEFIEDHYKAKADDYLEAIAELSDLRQVRTQTKTGATQTRLFGSSAFFIWILFIFFKLPVMISTKNSETNPKQNRNHFSTKFCLHFKIFWLFFFFFPILFIIFCFIL